jgi:hypothetical protein
MAPNCLSRPIQRLSDAAERLSENLDSPPLEESGPLEARAGGTDLQQDAAAHH